MGVFLAVASGGIIGVQTCRCVGVFLAVARGGIIFCCGDFLAVARDRGSARADGFAARAWVGIGFAARDGLASWCWPFSWGGVELSLSEAAFFEGRGYSIGGLAMCAAVGVDCFWGKVDFVAGGGGLLQGTSGGGLALSAAVGVGRF